MLKPLNDNIFILRDPVDTTHRGVEISEKALTKNYVGVIKAIESDKNVTFGVGDRVHLPHYQVSEWLVDGVEYAVVKGSDLFAKLEDETYRPVNGYVRVRKCENDHVRDSSGKVALYMTENHIENTNWVEVIDVADDCKHIRKEWVGYFCIAPESSDKLQRILYSKDYMLHESAIEFLTDGE